MIYKLLSLAYNKLIEKVFVWRVILLCGIFDLKDMIDTPADPKYGFRSRLRKTSESAVLNSIRTGNIDIVPLIVGTFVKTIC